MAAAAGADGGAGGAEGGGADGGDEPVPAAAPGRAQVFSAVVDTFLEKLVAAGSYQRFVSCYRCFYKLQPQLTRSIYDQFISQLQTSIKEEIQDVKNEGNLEGLFSLLDKIVEEAKDREEPAWRPSGVPARDVRSALVPFLLRHRSHLRRALQERQHRSSSLAQEVLKGRDSIAELQQVIQARQEAWQAITKEQRELIMALQELQ
ncbi:polyamine-modulated factor 1 [Ammospiza nelsoni]|uniref:polyamine-modulated factor 1 n=1 Tax=Ammospiza caudacuta TaxID=2857398 RepID=UPI00273A2AC9|nr:polyamine-modulated factor 1 [Ammospiza caudacuta]XP_059346475.1 polyamine-modulated factor 1 [Ammospiza nelsoni]